MSCASDDRAVPIVDLPLAEDVQQAISKLMSLHDGDIGVVETVACGKRAVPALRAIVFAPEPSGLYETRRRAVEALAQLRAYDVLIDYLAQSRPHEIVDPIERTGEEAVINAAARAVAESDDPRVVPLLLELIRRQPLAGVIEALGRFRRADALSDFVRALAEDSARLAAEQAIRLLGAQTRPALLRAAILRSPSDEQESVSSLRRRRSALALLAELGLPRGMTWPPLSVLMCDEDPRIACLACQLCLASAPESERMGAIRRLIALLGYADWLLAHEIEDCLVKHFDKAREIVEEVLQHTDAGADLESPGTRKVQSLLSVARRAAPDLRRERP